jgi:hypothetical protein
MRGVSVPVENAIYSMIITWFDLIRVVDVCTITLPDCVVLVDF